MAIHGACPRKRWAEFSMEPQDGLGGCWPRPRQDSEASAMMASAMARVACTSSGGTMLGRTWTSAVRHGGFPMERAASTHSVVFASSAMPRARRTKIDVAEMAMASIAFSKAGPRKAARAIARIRKGTDSIASVTREIAARSEEHTSELQSRPYLVCRLLLEKKRLYLSRPPSIFSTFPCSFYYVFLALLLVPLPALSASLAPHFLDLPH